MADYVFYRLFDVKNCTISDQMDDTVGGIEVKYVFNRESVRPLDGTELRLDDKDEERNTVACKETLTLAGENSPLHLNNLKLDVNGDGMLEKEDKNVKQVQVKLESLPGSSENREITGTAEESRSSLGAENVGCKVGGEKDKSGERVKSGRKSGSTDDTPSKRAKSDGTVPSLKANDRNGVQSLAVPEKEAHANPESKLVKNSVGSGKDMKLAEGSSDWDKKLSKTNFSLSKSRSGHYGDAAALEKDAKLTKDLNTLQGGVSNINAFPPTEKSESAHLKDSIGTEKDRKLGGSLSACKGRQPTSNDDSRNEKAGPSINNFSSSETPKSASNKQFGASKQAEKFVKSSSASMKRQLKTSVNMHKEKSRPRYNVSHENKDTTLAKGSCPTEGEASKKAKYDDSLKISEDNKNNTSKKLKERTCVGETKHSPMLGTSYDDEAISRLGKGTLKESHNEKMGKLPNDNLRNLSTREDNGGKVKGQIFEVSRRPIVEKNKWMKLPWEERMKAAHDQGRLVLLQNLDPEYTSGEVEDIIWSAFREGCTAKMVQHTAISNPHSGQAFVIFKTREAVDRVVKKLDDGCLLLPNQRPLVACSGVFPQLFEKQMAFVGHLSIDKARRQIQREMKDAVSTSHYSQNNTIEYEMAMSWCLLQSKSDKWWEMLYEQQRKEIRKLMHDVKSK
ncbi:hypothetical protein CDL12_29279 [Handroanthus impetiginosus]|uniref:RRM domain-containing protein n=1 Tax=Handroanthus impetiginosus TaxID=429701 RepID=A0A2G9FYW4_9LAMI|nr:hypothetical protein CDL12_29279 [Handroanthus impetiginosus]